MSAVQEVRLPADEDALLTTRQAAAMLAISEKTLWSLTKAGTIPVCRIGERSVRYSRRALRHYVDELVGS